MKRTPSHLDGMYVAFNKHIVEEIKLKSQAALSKVNTLRLYP